MLSLLIIGPHINSVFPQFILLRRVQKKVEQDQVERMLTVPHGLEQVLEMVVKDSSNLQEEECEEESFDDEESNCCLDDFSSDGSSFFEGLV